MKFLPKLLSLSLLLGIYSIPASAQESRTNVLQRGYYLVIGAYSERSEGYASRFQQSVVEKGHPAKYGFANRKNMYFVYLHFSNDFSESLTELYKYRELEDFDDCWVFVNKDSGDPMEGERIDLADQREEEAENKDAITEESEDQEAEEAEDLAQDDNLGKDQEDKPVGDEEKDQSTDDAEPVEKKEETSGYKLYFNPFGAQGVKPVTGTVEVVDPVRAKLIRQYDIYETQIIPDPKNGTGDIEIICSAFGFKKSQHWLNLHEPLNDSTSEYVTVSGDSIIVDFALTRLRKGDIAIMYNVFFYRDAAIMKPESKYELNALLTMLQENENMRIKIHGHTNGNYNGKLIKLNKDDVDFFSLKGNHIETVGTSKALSKQRAYTIQHYLMEEGIAEDRMEIIGWGGKRHLFDKHSNRARYNVRVEVEVLEDGT